MTSTTEETLFIGGFPPFIKESELTTYFSTYKSLVNLSIVKNNKDESRGFGYVTFNDPKDIKSIVGSVHKIRGKMFRVKRLMNKEDVAKLKDDEIKRKVFLGGLNKMTTEAGIEGYFSKWGKIEDILINRNIEDNSSKGCAFLLFREFKVAQKLIWSKEMHVIDGNYVEVKQCYDKSRSKALKEEKVLKNTQFGETGLDFMNLCQENNYGLNMGLVMNSFMLNFVNNFSGPNLEQANNYSDDLIKNQSFKNFLNTSHSNFMMDYSNLSLNPLVSPQIPFQNCPVYQMKPADQPLKSTQPVSKCPFNFSAKDTQKNMPISESKSFLKCPFSSVKKTPENEESAKKGVIQSTVSTGNMYSKYLMNTDLIAKFNPHKDSGYPSTGFNRCPLAHLLQIQSSESEGEDSRDSVNFNFEEKEVDKRFSKCFLEMTKASKKFNLLHLEENLEFRPVKKATVSACPFRKKTHV